MRSELRGFIPLLKEALARGVVVSKDVTRRDFYDVELNGLCFYIHVYAKMRVVYLIGMFPSEAIADRRALPETTASRGMALVG